MGDAKRIADVECGIQNLLTKQAEYADINEAANESINNLNQRIADTEARVSSFFEQQLAHDEDAKRIADVENRLDNVLAENPIHGSCKQRTSVFLPPVKTEDAEKQIQECGIENLPSKQVEYADLNQRIADIENRLDSVPDEAANSISGLVARQLDALATQLDPAITNIVKMTERIDQVERSVDPMAGRMKHLEDSVASTVATLTSSPLVHQKMDEITKRVDYLNTIVMNMATGRQ